MTFTQKLVRWYEQNKRDLPWRNTRDPYMIWLSEIILQQTRVDQGLPYWKKFVAHYPKVQDLAAAPEQEVLKLWQGLGYYSRARNLKFAAQQVVDEFGGEFPKRYDDILQLKGVGAYTAAAIASFAFGEARAVVDGNVYRVLARINGDDTPIDSTHGKKLFQAYADEALPVKDPGTHNQAIMEFGALKCTPKSPDCASCPFEDSCVARRKNRIEDLPVKAKKIKRRSRYFEYLDLNDGAGGTYYQLRPKGDIWQGLYELPLLEFDQAMTTHQVINSAAWRQIFKEYPSMTFEVNQPVKHVLSHQDIFARVWRISDPIPNPLAHWLALPAAEIPNYPMSKLMEILTTDS